MQMICQHNPAVIQPLLGISLPHPPSCRRTSDYERFRVSLECVQIYSGSNKVSNGPLTDHTWAVGSRSMVQQVEDEVGDRDRCAVPSMDLLTSSS